MTKVPKQLTPFKKGQSGNPKGRPVGAKDYKTIMWEALEKIAKETGKESADEIYKDILAKGAIQARKGQFNFYKDMLDRTHGKAEDKIDVTSGGEKLIDESAILDKVTKILNG